ncbi:hypothetical protein KGP36_08050 [Patescibacteria group bacterium]|nr:hypothetical protein [Patescibacteria group bacterium]
MKSDTSAEALEQLAKGMGFEDQVAHYDAMIDAILAIAAEKRRAREGVTDDIEARLDTVLAAMRRLYLHYKDQPCGTDFGRMVRLLELAQQKRALYELAQQSQELGLYEDTDHD